MASTALHHLIIERIRREGPITFAEYMRMALYTPDLGYYMTEPAKIGWDDADYYTSTDVSPFFAHCVGRQLYQWWEKLGHPPRFNVLEQGAGRGHLAREVITWASQAAPDFSTALHYSMADIRLGQNARAPEQQAPHPSRENVGAALACPPPLYRPPLVHHHTARRADQQRAESNAPSVILSNELIDAFPVHLVEVRNERLYEVYVDVQDGRLCEVLDKPASPEVASYLDSYNIPWASFGDGWRTEINLDALQWMRRTAQLIRRGFILTIDYGDRARALYTRYRRRGTLACYFRHQVNERPLIKPGEQDITAHVNFSALIDEGRRRGLRLHKFTTQRLWLESLGITEELEQRRLNEFSAADTARATDEGQIALFQWYNLRQQVAALTDPMGMGDFKVLILRR